MFFIFRENGSFVTFKFFFTAEDIPRYQTEAWQNTEPRFNNGQAQDDATDIAARYDRMIKRQEKARRQAAGTKLVKFVL